MNRRSFIASIPFLPSAAKAVLTPAVALAPSYLGNNEIQWLYRKEPYDPTWLAKQPITWLQTTRTTRCVSMEYEDALDKIRGGCPVILRRNWHERRRVRFKENLARQLATPAPKLP